MCEGQELNGDTLEVGYRRNYFVLVNVISHYM